MASDGKWYPADAEPGAVYEGDLPNEPAAAEAAPAPAAEPVVAAPEPVAPTPEPVTPAPEPVASEPVVPTPEPLATEAVSPVIEDPAPASFGADPFAQMPAPVVEEPRSGGWQTIDPGSPAVEPTPPVAEPVATAPTAPAGPPTAPAAVPPQPATPDVQDDDGWTSAYEELNDGVDANAPDPTMSAATTTSFDPVPAVEIPDVQAPPAVAPPEAPTVAPTVEAPPTVAPPVSEPVVSVPDPSAAVASPTPEAPTDIPEVAPPVIDPGPATVERDAAAPIERDDAWRKPLNEDIPRPAASAPTGVPDVVDLAIPEEPATYVPEPQGRNWGTIGGVLVALAIICGLAFLLVRLFTGGDDDVSTADESDNTPAVTDTEPDEAEASAPSTDTTAEDAGDEGESDDNVSVFALRAGDCIVGDIGAGQVTKVTKVDCEEPHQFEVYREALIESSITEFDEEAISAYAEEVCRTSLEAYIPPDDDRGLKFKFLQPTEDSWNQAEDPDRVITCLLFDDDAPLVGRAA